MTTHSHQMMPVFNVARHLTYDHGYTLRLGENVFDVHDHLHSTPDDPADMCPECDSPDLRVVSAERTGWFIRCACGYTELRRELTIPEPRKGN